MAARDQTIEAAKARHEMRLLGIDGVEGVGIGEESGRKVIKVYVTAKTRTTQEQIPSELDGYPIAVEVSGEFRAQGN